MTNGMTTNNKHNKKDIPEREPTPPPPATTTTTTTNPHPDKSKDVDGKVSLVVLSCSVIYFSFIFCTDSNVLLSKISFPFLLQVISVRNNDETEQHFLKSGQDAEHLIAKRTI